MITGVTCEREVRRAALLPSSRACVTRTTHTRTYVASPSRVAHRLEGFVDTFQVSGAGNRVLFSSLLLSHLSPRHPDGSGKYPVVSPRCTPPRSFYSLVSAKATRRISHVGESARRRRRAARRKRAQARPARTDSPHGVGFVGGLGLLTFPFLSSFSADPAPVSRVLFFFCFARVWCLVLGLGGVWGVVRCVCFVCVLGVGVSVLAGVPLPPSI